MKYQFTKLQRIIILWFALFTVLCLANSLLVIMFVRSYEQAFTAVFLPPFVHCGIVVVYHLGSVIKRCIGRIGNDEEYIKVNHPQIWKKLHPWGDYSLSSFGWMEFIGGNYDDGTDERLAEMRRKYSIDMILLVYPFVLTLWTWLLNVFLLILFGMVAGAASR